MKHRAIAAAIAMLVAAPAAADPIYGIWATTQDDNGNSGHIEIAACGDAICGTLVQSFDRDGNAFESESIGRQVIWDMKPRRGGNYGGGKVYSPDRDQTYAGKLQLDGDNLTIQGCVLVVCRDGGVWTRVQ